MQLQFTPWSASPALLNIPDLPSLASFFPVSVSVKTFHWPSAVSLYMMALPFHWKPSTSYQQEICLHDFMTAITFSFHWHSASPPPAFLDLRSTHSPTVTLKMSHRRFSSINSISKAIISTQCLMITRIIWCFVLSQLSLQSTPLFVFLIPKARTRPI